MQERHDILSQTIGYLDKEQEALDTGYYLLIGSFMIVVIGTAFQIWFFWLYNGSFHPFANILKQPSDISIAKCKCLVTITKFTNVHQLVCLFKFHV